LIWRAAPEALALPPSYGGRTARIAASRSPRLKGLTRRRLGLIPKVSTSKKFKAHEEERELRLLSVEFLIDLR
jgi:hypothetical protein